MTFARDERHQLVASKGKDKMPNSEEASTRVGTGDDAPWVEKYRPEDMHDIVAHADILNTLERFVDSGRLPHMLFYGPPGTGKTTAILALARRIYGKAFRNFVMELNASDDRGIDIVRDKIKSFASTRQMFDRRIKLIILDEADAMTLIAQNALRRVIEKYTTNVRFCLICNYINKITPAIQSRCTRFRFRPLPTVDIVKRLNYVVDQEHVNLTEDGRTALIKLSRGDLRKVLNILQACASIYSSIGEAEVYRCVGNPRPQDINAILTCIMNEHFTSAANYLSKMQSENGFALQDIVTGTFERLSQLDIPDKFRIYALDALADIEYRLSAGASLKIQSSALIAAIRHGCEIGERK